MDAIMEKTRELGEAILASEAYKKMEAAEKAINEDLDARMTMMEFEAARTEVQTMMQSPDVDREKLMTASSKFRSAQERVQNNAVICHYLETRADFTEIIDQVNALLKFLISGETEESCSGSCDHCGGCH